MKTFFSMLAVYVFLISNAVAAPPKITTKILEVQLWSGTHVPGYYFKIENPGLVNPANCAETDWVVTASLRQMAAPELDEMLVNTKKDNSSVTLAIAESFCIGRFPAVRAVIF